MTRAHARPAYSGAARHRAKSSPASRPCQNRRNPLQDPRDWRTLSRKSGGPLPREDVYLAHRLSLGEAVSLGFGSKCERLIRIACRSWMTADVHAANCQAPAGSRKNSRSLIRIINIADQLRSMLRRANERNRLAQLSSREWRDLGEDRAREELNKWPWQG
jgi:hypothetical protein